MIRGKHVVLRAPEPRDTELLHQWSNDPEIWAMLGGWHFPYSEASTRAWIDHRKDGDPTDQVYCIDAPDLGLIGTISLLHIDWKNRTASHGIMLGNKELHGKGYATDALMALLRYAFDELGLRRVDAEVIAYNSRSLKLGERIGWKVEGRRRDGFYRGGRFHDKVLIGITREDYAERLRESRYWDPAPDPTGGPAKA